jgi:hypothetical protein
MVSIKASMASTASASDMIQAINTVEAAMKLRFPQVRWSFFEPDEAD